MSLKNKQEQNTNTNLNRTTSEKVTDLADYSPQFQSALSALTAANKSQVRAPSLSLPKNPFSTGFDPLVNYGYSRALEGLKAQEGTAGRALSNQLNIKGTGENSALLAALLNSNSRNTALQSNALMPAALEQQRAFDIERQKIVSDQNAQKLGLFTAQNAQKGNQLSAFTNQMNTLANLVGARAGRVGTDTMSGTVQQTGSTKKPFVSK